MSNTEIRIPDIQRMWQSHIFGTSRCVSSDWLLLHFRSSFYVLFMQCHGADIHIVLATPAFSFFLRVCVWLWIPINMNLETFFWFVIGSLVQNNHVCRIEANFSIFSPINSIWFGIISYAWHAIVKATHKKNWKRPRAEWASKITMITTTATTISNCMRPTVASPTLKNQIKGYLHIHSFVFCFIPHFLFPPSRLVSEFFDRSVA